MALAAEEACRRSSVNVQTKTDPNHAPTFSDRTTTRSVAENTATNQIVGDPVTAEDTESSTLTYSLSGSDAASFSINESTGQISTKVALDYEAKRSYRVTVTATDPSLARATATVTINIIDEDEPPTLTGDISVDYVENGTGTVATYKAADPEKRPIVWSLSGSDDDKFTIEGGLLKFKSPPDFEARASNRNRQRIYGNCVCW